MAYRVGIDVGGTFTDCVLARPDHSLSFTKVPTTPADQSAGVLDGIAALAALEGLSLSALLKRTSMVVHGTTTADNTMIQMNGAVTGLITTAGHRDEIELRRGFKENIWDPALLPPPPIALRRRRIGVPERLDYRGEVVTALDENAVRAALRRLRMLDTESIAVVFMFSFLNPRHELRVREIAAEECPAISLSLSHEVMPSAPEFERTSTTLVNAYVGPRIERYVRRLVDRLREERFKGSLLVMQSNGGIMAPEYILRRPVTVLGSGPTGGVTAACSVARQAGCADFVCGDMGGTSYDVCLVRGGAPEIKSGWNWHHRYLIGLPMVDVHSIGAGGGSIASVVAATLQVGPQSAGAQPGPACYARGGRLPTVTDANVVLGYINSEGFCGGTMNLDRTAAHTAIAEHVARPLGISVTEAAHGIYRLVNANMANAIRRVSAARGIDPRTLTMVSYGGNGGVHATAQAAELGIQRVLVPKMSPAFSALGLLLSDHLIDELRAYITSAASADLRRVNRLLRDLERSARATLARRKSLLERIVVRRFAHLCYPGQTFDMPVPIDTPVRGAIDRATWEATVERFHQLHEQLHTYAARDQVPMLRSLRVSAGGVTAKPSLPIMRRTSARAQPVTKRRAFFDGAMTIVPVYSGPQLRAGQAIRGPAIIEEPFTTVLLSPGELATLTPQSLYAIDLCADAGGTPARAPSRQRPRSKKVI